MFPEIKPTLDGSPCTGITVAKRACDHVPNAGAEMDDQSHKHTELDETYSQHAARKRYKIRQKFN